MNENTIINNKINKYYINLSDILAFFRLVYRIENINLKNYDSSIELLIIDFINDLNNVKNIRFKNAVILMMVFGLRFCELNLLNIINLKDNYIVYINAKKQKSYRIYNLNKDSISTDLYNRYLTFYKYTFSNKEFGRMLKRNFRKLYNLKINNIKNGTHLIRHFSILVLRNYFNLDVETIQYNFKWKNKYNAIEYGRKLYYCLSEPL